MKDAESERMIEVMEKINIIDKKIQTEIIKNHKKAFWKWQYSVKTKKIVIKSNHGGHLLKTLGLI
jgi:hypothetical protein